LSGETMRILTLLKAYFERKLNKGKAKLLEVSISLILETIINLEKLPDRYKPLHGKGDISSQLQGRGP
jgi:hypothetical protein